MSSKLHVVVDPPSCALAKEIHKSLWASGLKTERPIAIDGDSFEIQLESGKARSMMNCIIPRLPPKVQDAACGRRSRSKYGWGAGAMPQFDDDKVQEFLVSIFVPISHGQAVLEALSGFTMKKWRPCRHSPRHAH